MRAEILESEARHELRTQEVVIPERHIAALQRSQRIAGMVGARLEVQVVPAEDIPPHEGVYLIQGEVDAEAHDDITSTTFELEPFSLSGKIDSAHHVLPGKLSVAYDRRASKGRPNKLLEIAAKGYYKRPFADSFARVKKEIAINKMQEETGEITFTPVAVVIAEPPYEGKGTDYTDYDIILVTRLEEAVTTLDNAAWQLGYTPGNLQAAEAAVDALARFNTHVGKHGDAKIKNVAQRPNGETSMIDFETSEVSDLSDPLVVADIAQKDVGLLFDSWLDRGFFTAQIESTYEVITKLSEIYLSHWTGSSEEVQDVVYQQILELSETYIGYSQQRAYAYDSQERG